MQITEEAAALGVYPHEYALANGLVPEAVYYAALAKAYKLHFSPDVRDIDFPMELKMEEVGLACRAGLVRASANGRAFYLAAPYGHGLAQILARLAGTPALRADFVLTTPAGLRHALLRRNTKPLLDHAVNMLRRRRPADSARRSYRPFFAGIVVVLTAVILSVLYRAPVFAPVFGAVCAGLYLLACYFRILAYADYFEWRFARVPHLPDENLPLCSVLVPIYDEARLVPQLLQALSAIDYPRPKLDILLLIEQNDTATAKALQIARPPPECRVIVVPHGQPRTKPRALQVGLSFARGEIVTIFDAEDVPHPLQLRHAARQLHAGGPRLACVQAQLRIDNGRASWLAKQFALEYAALSTVFMPSLAKRGYPVLLSGTSNYFRTSVLRQIGGWDPWNVTEDADLGIRLARAGYIVGTLETPTEEEAPVTLENWLRQRMRWQKGWMQTLIVHFSQFGRLRKELGLRNMVALIATLGVSLLSAFSYPVLVLWIAAGLILDFKSLGASILGAGVFGACLSALIGGHIFPLLHLHAGAKRAGQSFDLFSLCTVWFYWLLVSLSAYCALFDLARSPYRWFKTEHLGRKQGQKKIKNLREFFSPRRSHRSHPASTQAAPVYQSARQMPNAPSPRPVIRFSDYARASVSQTRP